MQPIQGVILTKLAIDWNFVQIVINQASQVNWTDSKVAGTTPWAELVRPYVAQVHAIEAELGVVHDIVLGTTWDESLEVGFAWVRVRQRDPGCPLKLK